MSIDVSLGWATLLVCVCVCVWGWRTVLMTGCCAWFADRDFWYEEARATLRQRLSLAGQTRPAPRAKNVILMVGDGMGVSTVTAARILRGQRQGRAGEDATLAWDRFPTVGLAKVSGVFSKIAYYLPTCPNLFFPTLSTVCRNVSRFGY